MVLENKDCLELSLVETEMRLFVLAKDIVSTAGSEKTKKKIIGDFFEQLKSLNFCLSVEAASEKAKAEWAKQLEDYPIDLIERAFSQYIKISKFPPKPIDIFDLIRSYPEFKPWREKHLAMQFEQKALRERLEYGKQKQRQLEKPLAEREKEKEELEERELRRRAAEECQREIDMRGRAAINAIVESIEKEKEEKERERQEALNQKFESESHAFHNARSVINSSVFATEGGNE